MNISLLTNIVIGIVALGVLFELFVRFFRNKKKISQPSFRTQEFDSENQTDQAATEENDSEEESEEITYDVDEEGSWNIFPRLFEQLTEEDEESLHEIDVWCGDDDDEDLIMNFEIDSEEGLRITLYENPKDPTFDRKFWLAQICLIFKDFEYDLNDNLLEDDGSEEYWFPIGGQSLEENLELSNRILKEIYLAKNPNKTISVCYLLEG